MKYYNKETYNEDGVFYRTLNNWAIESEEDLGDNFTTAEPKGFDQKVIPKQHFATKNWVLDEAIDQSTIDAMVKLDKLAVRRAMRTLGTEAQLDGLLNASAEFKSDWQDCITVDMTDPILLQALEQASIDVDEIKREIIKQGE